MLSPVERLLYLFIRNEETTTLIDIYRFRGKDDAHTRRVLRRLTFLNLITIRTPKDQKRIRIIKLKKYIV